MASEKIQKIYAKYGMRCAYCGYRIHENGMGSLKEGEANGGFSFRASIDHIVPLTDGGKNDESNLLPACFGCNHVKDNMSLSDFRNALLTGRISDGKKERVLAELKTPRYMIPYGKYVGVSGYMWGGKFYFEKNGEEKKECEKMADKIQPLITSTDNESADNSAADNSVVDEFCDKLKKKPIMTKNGIVIVSGVPSKLKTNKTTADKAKMKPAAKPADKPKTEKTESPVSGNAQETENVASKSRRKYLYEASGYRCAYCGCHIKGYENTVGTSNAAPSKLDPKGGYTKTNTVAACQECAAAKNGLDIEEFRQLIFDINFMPKKSARQLRKSNYSAFKNGRFYFELEAAEKDVIDVYWNGRLAGLTAPEEKGNTEEQAVPVNPAAGPEAKNSVDFTISGNINGTKVIVPNISIPKIFSTPTHTDVDERTAAIARPLIEELKELSERQKKLLEEADVIGRRMDKLQIAVNALESLNSSEAPSGDPSGEFYREGASPVLLFDVIEGGKNAENTKHGGAV